MFRKMGLKLSPLVRNEGGWDAETRDPTKQECLGDCFCAGIGE